jgi:hypothetical protein
MRSETAGQPRLRSPGIQKQLGLPLATGISAPCHHIRPDAWPAEFWVACCETERQIDNALVHIDDAWSALKPTSVLLFRSNSRLESREHCWLAAKTAASLAGAVPPCDVRADTVGVGTYKQRVCYPCATTSKAGGGDSRYCSQGCERARRERLVQCLMDPTAKPHRSCPAVGVNAAPSNSLPELCACHTIGTQKRTLDRAPLPARNL